MNPAWGKRLKTALLWPHVKPSQVVRNLALHSASALVGVNALIPKKQLKLQTPHIRGLLVSAFCNSIQSLFFLFFSLGGNSFQKWLGAVLWQPRGAPWQR